MKSKTLLLLLSITGLTSIFTLSSFYRPTSNENFPDNKNEILYKSNGKETAKNNKITLSSAFENDFYMNNKREGNYYVEVKAEKYQNTDATHIPLNISVVIDRSGSMAGDKIKNAKKAAKYIVDQLSSQDFLSIVIYDGSIDLLQSTTAVTDKQFIKNKIDNIEERGGTNLMGGALKGYEEVKRFYKSGYVNRVLLLSDGQANEGITNPVEIEKIVRNQNIENGISISTFGLGNDYNENLMTAMAETGTGNYYFIDDAEKIAGIFKKELNGLMEIVAKNASVTITIPEFVNIEKVYGFKYEQIGNKLTVNFHDVFSEETKGILIKYRVQNNTNSAVKFSAKLNYNDVDEELSKQLSTENKVVFTNQQTVFNENYNEWVSSQIALYESNEKLEMAMQEVDKGNYEQARKMVKENKDYITKNAPLVSKSKELQRASTANAMYEDKIVHVEAMPESEKKYIQKFSKSENYMIRNKK